MDLDIWSHIIELSNFKMKLKILKLSYSHYNYNFIIKEISTNTTYLTDDILKQKKYHKLHTLNASNNSKITNDKLLLETDSPFLAPIPMRGKKNEPSFIKYTIDKLAELKNVNANEMIKITSKNFENLFLVNEN